MNPLDSHEQTLKTGYLAQDHPARSESPTPRERHHCDILVPVSSCPIQTYGRLIIPYGGCTGQLTSVLQSIQLQRQVSRVLLLPGVVSSRFWNSSCPRPARTSTNRRIMESNSIKPSRKYSLNFAAIMKKKTFYLERF